MTELYLSHSFTMNTTGTRDKTLIPQVKVHKESVYTDHQISREFIGEYEVLEFTDGLVLMPNSMLAFITDTYFKNYDFCLQYTRGRKGYTKVTNQLATEMLKYNNYDSRNERERLVTERNDNAILELLKLII